MSFSPYDVRSCPVEEASTDGLGLEGLLRLGACICLGSCCNILAKLGKYSSYQADNAMYCRHPREEVVLCADYRPR